MQTLFISKCQNEKILKVESTKFGTKKRPLLHIYIKPRPQKVKKIYSSNKSRFFTSNKHRVADISNWNFSIIQKTPRPQNSFDKASLESRKPSIHTIIDRIHRDQSKETLISSDHQRSLF